MSHDTLGEDLISSGGASMNATVVVVIDEESDFLEKSGDWDRDGGIGMAFI
jgi:hypothetical protein